jgi:2-polyprenyl-3-methyl-5-hydroxy-6-metoxy-1,4-benzoquinol methylase
MTSDDISRAGGFHIKNRVETALCARLAIGGFDTIVALDTIAHVAHWTDKLAEWKRSARPGGRLVFDLFSLDHYRAAGAARGSSIEAARGVTARAAHRGGCSVRRALRLGEFQRLVA